MTPPETEAASSRRLRRSALAFIVLMGVVSMFSDMTHEGGKSILGAYLTLTGASAAAVGFISGFGELAGYSLRYLTGRLADRTKWYWTLTILGYAIDLFAVPALALVPENGWLWAAALLIVERGGKALKKPAKDTLLSFVASQNGVGKSFALQEFLDQLGAFLGPVILFAVMARSSAVSLAAYCRCFALLIFPALVTLALLFVARYLFPTPENFEPESRAENFSRFGWGRRFTLYIAGISLFSLGFMDFPLITMHAAKTNLLTPGELPLLYAGAMAVDAFAALFFGWLYDRWDTKALVISTLLTAPFGFFVFLAPGQWALWVGASLWGIGMGAQESVLKAAVARLVPKARRSSGYGTFQTAFGVCLFLGSWFMGWLYERSLWEMVLFSVAAQVLAAILFLLSGRTSTGRLSAEEQ